MFDPTCFIANGRWGYICAHTGTDYNETPAFIRYNPLRWQVGIGRGRPCPIVLNKGGALYRRFSDLRWRLWGKRRFERKDPRP